MKFRVEGEGVACCNEGVLPQGMVERGECTAKGGAGLVEIGPEERGQGVALEGFVVEGQVGKQGEGFARVEFARLAIVCLEGGGAEKEEVHVGWIVG